MKRFSPEACHNRLLDRMRPKVAWAIISQTGVISALLDTFAEGHAEIARYAEYLLGEKKWDTAQNISSLNTQTGLIGRKSHRKRSAISSVVISHTDENGVDRLKNLGRTFFSLDDRSNYDNISKDPDPQDIFRTQTLTAWTYDTPYVIPRYSRFLTPSGIEFIATSTVASRNLKEPWDIIANDSERKNTFLSTGGWDGIKYLKIPVIQGKIKDYIFGKASGSRFESFLLPVSNCEDATNSVSKEFLKLYVDATPDKAGNKEEWIQVPNLLLAGPYDRVFEVVNLPDYSGVIFKVGDGITGKRLPQEAEISVKYLETAGNAGNVEKKYQVNNILFPTGFQQIDPRTQAVSKFLSVTNTSPILGGKDEENEDDLRRDAPQDYLNFYTIATIDAYERQIKDSAQIGLSKLKVFSGSKITDYARSFDKSRQLSDISTSQSALYVTAVSANGGKVEDPENSLIYPVTRAIGDTKAPSDTLMYIEPTFVKLRLNTIVHSDNSDIADEDIINMERQALKDKYTIHNRDFKDGFYNSKYIGLTESFPFVNHTETFVEALANVRIDKSDVNLVPARSSTLVTPTGPKQMYYPALYRFRFRFDKIFGRNPYARGFKNYLQGAAYLLRVDIQIKNDSSKASRLNRTIFLYDHRSLYRGVSDLTVEQGKYTLLDDRPVVTNKASIPDWNRPEETLEDYSSRCCRLAQFPYQSAITDDKKMVANLKAVDRTPFEIRPYVTDKQGKNKIFKLEEVTWPSNEDDPRVPLPGGIQCYKRDWRYIDYLDVEFNENYDNPESTEFAFGYLTLPASYFEFNYIDIEKEEQFIGALNNFVTIKITAQPLNVDIEPQDWNEILFCEESDIKVERVKSTK